jgi:P-type Cu+ transporter
MSSAAVTNNASSQEVHEVELVISGMTCAACAARVEKKLGTIPDVMASVNYATAKAAVTAPSAMPVDVLIEAVEQAGYGAEPVPSAAARAGETSPEAARAAYLRRRLIVAVVFFVPRSDRLDVVRSAAARRDLLQPRHGWHLRLRRRDLGGSRADAPR